MADHSSGMAGLGQAACIAVWSGPVTHGGVGGATCGCWLGIEATGPGTGCMKAGCAGTLGLVLAASTAGAMAGKRGL